MSEVAPNGYAVLPLEIELPQGALETQHCSEPQLVKRGSYVNGQLAAEESGQNTAEDVHWCNYMVTSIFV
jgi:hypothetical protein